MATVMLAALHLDRQKTALTLENEVQLTVAVRIVIVQLETMSRQLLRNCILIDRTEVDVGLPVIFL